MVVAIKRGAAGRGPEPRGADRQQEQERATRDEPCLPDPEEEDRRQKRRQRAEPHDAGLEQRVLHSRRRRPAQEAEPNIICGSREEIQRRCAAKSPGHRRVCRSDILRRVARASPPSAAGEESCDYGDGQDQPLKPCDAQKSRGPAEDSQHEQSRCRSHGGAPPPHEIIPTRRSPVGLMHGRDRTRSARTVKVPTSRDAVTRTGECRSCGLLSRQIDAASEVCQTSPL